MRQRYLVGKMNRERLVYIEGLIDETYNPNQMYIQSTDVLRTMQSSYSELLGLYPPGIVEKPSDKVMMAMKNNKALPPFKIRDKVLL